MFFECVNRAEQKLQPWVRYKPVQFNLPGGIASFTFDDFPKSATKGAKILENYESRGTFYVAFGLAGSENHLGRMCNFDDVRTLHKTGHEIGCHTYSHLDCSQAGVEAILAEVSKNDMAHRSVIDDAKMINFAFPFGASSFASRRALRDRFVCCRGVRAGVNSGPGDLTYLRSVHLYHHLFDDLRVRRLIDRSKSLGAWIIFYTHDVSTNPSAFGCTPQELEAIVAYASASMPVVTVREAIRRLDVHALLNEHGA
jgi:peptidoglycan/xylan/chitin deacetylase (PgdA/CDA1 family)